MTQIDPAPGGSFHDELVPAGTKGLPDRFFDRLMFNMHPADGARPSIIMGFGMYPAKNTVDGFVQVSDTGQQRNLRYSTLLSETDGGGGGPFSFEVVVPNKTWKLHLAPNPSDVEFDLTWEARTPAWFGEVGVDNAIGESTAFDHLFQSGTYTGTLTIDGSTQSVDGWYGQRAGRAVCAPCPGDRDCISGFRRSSPICPSVFSRSRHVITAVFCSKAPSCT
jgi:hypothetical protein